MKDSGYRCKCDVRTTIGNDSLKKESWPAVIEDPENPTMKSEPAVSALTMNLCFWMFHECSGTSIVARNSG